MNLRFTARMVRRELRASRRRLALHMLSITLGVAALVAVNSFRANIERSVTRQARTVLGSDLELTRRQPFGDSVQALLDSTAASGVRISYRTGFGSMALAPRTGLTRLVQVRATEGEYPYYGTVETEPAGLWRTFRSGPNALLDPAVLIYLDIAVGDSIRLGDQTFTVAGTITNYPGRVSLEAAIGPRVYIPRRYLAATNLIRQGSRAFYEANLAIPDADELRRYVSYNEDLLDRSGVDHDTVEETEDDLAYALDTLARFLGLVGLAALLLGGVGVASAVHVYVKSRLDTVAVLRCLGARQRTVFAIYLVQAAAMGLFGAAIGVALGVGVQYALPPMLADILPVDIDVQLHVPALFTGLGIGAAVALLFAFFPLLTIRDTPPLRALRRAFDGSAARRWRDPWFLAAGVALVGAVIGLSLWQAPEARIGMAFAGTAAVGAVVLWIAAVLLMRGTRRWFPSRARYVFRQGVANLFRPRNQTVAVTIALGFGVFLIATLFVVQRGLIDQFRIDSRPDRPNLVLFDVQGDQRSGVAAVMEEHHLPILQRTPIVPARLARLNGRTIDEILDTPGAYEYERWALERQYRHTYRDTLVASEAVIRGRWWHDGSDEPGWQGGGGIPRISMERDVAESLKLGVGDRVTWNVQGVEIETEVASLRQVNWARFEPNFFVVFEPGVLENAPQMTVILSRENDPGARALFQRDLVTAFPNVVALDLTQVQRSLDTIIDRVTLAIRFMALFSISAGLIILVGALNTSRGQRVRESVLLKTMGATARQIRTVLVTEYFTLGAMGGLVGVLLATAAGWLSMRFLFEVPFSAPALPLGLFWLGTGVLTTTVGVLAGRDVTRRPPLEVMREMSE